MKLPKLFISYISIASFSLAHANANATEATSTDTDEKISTITVTATGAAKNKNELAESVSVFNKNMIEAISPSHPSEILNRSAGVYINNLGGEGHMTAIRQPISTKGVYLFLEDGIPTRPSGFFNHNGLYEVNIPQSGTIEVIKGPATALYGSEAIGGVINSLTDAPSDTLETMVNLEGGSDQWQRVLFSNSATVGDHGYRININSTQSDTFRDDADFDRQSTTARWDVNKSDLNVKTLFSITEVDQSGSSSLNKDDYENRPEKNTFKSDIGGRNIKAARLSSEFIMDISDNQQLELTPFYRNNDSSMMPSWMVSYDPNSRETKFETFGLLSKWRQDLSSIDGELVLGVDIDHSPSRYKEFKVTMTEEERDGDTYYLGYQKTGDLHYDFDAKQNVVSPFAQFDMAISQDWRFAAGLRYDYFKVDYDDNLTGQAEDSKHIRPDSQKVSYDSWSPKLGLIYQYSQQHNAYVNYRHAFRAPTVGELFRSGQNQQTDELKPVKADSAEIGLRGYVSDAVEYEAAIYTMVKRDDIVSIINDGNRETLNAGKTEHNGIELSLLGHVSQAWSYNLALSYTEQTYKKFEYFYQCFSPSCGANGAPIRETRNFNGNTIAQAPETLGNLSVAYQPSFIEGLRVELELQHIGEYYTDDNNTDTYNGHQLFNLRGSYLLNDNVEFYARVQNLTDELYSERTSKGVTDQENEYRPGSPRSYYAGIRMSF